jgi:hypothetical protein
MIEHTEVVYKFCEKFHLMFGMPFLCRELWHFAHHVGKWGIKQLLIKRGKL